MSSLSPEFLTVKRCSPQINEILAGTGSFEWIADHLFAKGFITRIELSKAHSTGTDNYTKTSQLMQSVISQISINPEKFAEFISILQEEPALEDLVKLLSDTYGKRSSQDSLPTYKHLLIDVISGYWGYLWIITGYLWRCLDSGCYLQWLLSSVVKACD